uniref:Uncharacterized protein n=1 Tax=Glossina pallidipes TaxID=7398 RepID=A0A1B0AB94_GLOPL
MAHALWQLLQSAAKFSSSKNARKHSKSLKVQLHWTQCLVSFDGAVKCGLSCKSNSNKTLNPCNNTYNTIVLLAPPIYNRFESISWLDGSPQDKLSFHGFCGISTVYLRIEKDSNATSFNLSAAESKIASKKAAVNT